MTSDDKAKETTQQMFALIGEAISEWSFVELSLCNLFTICVTSCPARPEIEGVLSMLDANVPNAIFYSIENFRGKLALVDAALSARITESGEWAQDIRRDWSRLKDKTRKLSLKRNKLAHWTVTPAFQDDDEFHAAALMPPYGSPGWWKETGVNPAGQSLKPYQIEHLVRAFSLLDAKLRCFYKNLARHPRLTDKFDKLTVRLIQSHDRLSPTRGEWIRQQISSEA